MKQQTKRPECLGMKISNLQSKKEGKDQESIPLKYQYAKFCDIFIFVENKENLSNILFSAKVKTNLLFLPSKFSDF